MPASAIAGAGLLVVAGLYWMASNQIAQSAMSGSVGADGLPKLLAAVLALLSLLLIAQSLILRRSPASPEDAAPEEEDEPGLTRRGHILAGALLAIAVAYVMVLPYLGYAVSVSLLLFAVAAFYGRKPGVGLFAFAVIGGAVLYLIFVELLGVRMPAGFWPALLASPPDAG